MNKSVIIWICIVIGAIVAWSVGSKSISIDAATPDKVGTALTALIFVALLIERVVEVFVAPVTGDNKPALQAERAAAQARIAELEALLNPPATVEVPAPVLPDEATATGYRTNIKDLKSLDAAKATEIAAIDKKTQKLALSFSVPISFVVALAGVRALGPLLADADKCGPGTAVAAVGDVAAKLATACDLQHSMLAVADVILTAGLLAGGADGIHKVLDRFIKLASGKETAQPPAS